MSDVEPDPDVVDYVPADPDPEPVVEPEPAPEPEPEVDHGPPPDPSPEEVMERLAAEDHRPRVTVSKPIDVALLTEELGAAICFSGAPAEAFEDGVEVTIVVADPDARVTQKRLEAVVEAHVAPPPPPPLSERIDEAIDSADDLPSLKAALKTLLKDELA